MTGFFPTSYFQHFSDVKSIVLQGELNKTKVLFPYPKGKRAKTKSVLDNLYSPYLHFYINTINAQKKRSEKKQVMTFGF